MNEPFHQDHGGLDCNCLINGLSAPSHSCDGAFFLHVQSCLSELAKHFAAGGLLSPALLEKASSSCGLAPPIGNECASAISEHDPDQQANCESNCQVRYQTLPPACRRRVRRASLRSQRVPSPRLRGQKTPYTPLSSSTWNRAFVVSLCGAEKPAGPNLPATKGGPAGLQSSSDLLRGTNVHFMGWERLRCADGPEALWAFPRLSNPGTHQPSPPATTTPTKRFGALGVWPGAGDGGEGRGRHGTLWNSVLSWAYPGRRDPCRRVQQQRSSKPSLAIACSLRRKPTPRSFVRSYAAWPAIGCGRPWKRTTRRHQLIAL